MSYALEAFLASPVVARFAADALPGTGVVTLHPGIALVPITPDVAHAVSPGDRSIISLLANRPLPDPLSELLRRASLNGPIAYVEADMFGGAGRQASVLWENGDVALGPLVDPAPERIEPSQEQMADRPFNQVLRRLGVSVAGGEPDEFATVGLGRYRYTEDWLRDVEHDDERIG